MEAEFTFGDKIICKYNIYARIYDVKGGLSCFCVTRRVCFFVYRFRLLPLVFLLLLSVNRPLFGFSHSGLHLLRVFRRLLPGVVVNKYILFKVSDSYT